MRIIFLGTPQSVLEPLQYLKDLKDKHELIAIISQPAKKAGRGKKLLDPPVAEFAKEHGIELFQPQKAGAADFLEQIRSLSPDLMITAAYGQILTDEFLEIPKRGTINIHPSLLPKYRGATPVPAALMAGDKITGVSILFTVKKLDAGNIIAQKKVEIELGETADKLTDRLFKIGTSLLDQSFKLLEDPDYLGENQIDEDVTHCRKISKEEGLIDWKNSGERILNNFRGLYPWPGSYTFQNEKRIAIESLELVDSDEDDAEKVDAVKADANEGNSGSQLLCPGKFSYLKKKKAVLVETGDGKLLIKRVKPAGSKSQDATAFWNGQKTKEGLSFAQEPS